MLLYHTSKLSILASIELFNVDSVYSQWYSSIMPDSTGLLQTPQIPKGKLTNRPAKSSQTLPTMSYNDGLEQPCSM